MNDNDDGSAVMRARTVTAGRSVCVSTVSFGLHRRGFGLFGKLGRQNERRFIGRAVGVAGVRSRCTLLVRWSGARSMAMNGDTPPVFVAGLR